MLKGTLSLIENVIQKWSVFYVTPEASSRVVVLLIRLN